MCFPKSQLHIHNHCISNHIPYIFYHKSPEKQLMPHQWSFPPSCPPGNCSPADCGMISRRVSAVALAVITVLYVFHWREDTVREVSPHIFPSPDFSDTRFPVIF